MLKSHKKLQDQFLKQVRQAVKKSTRLEKKTIALAKSIKSRKEFWLDIENMCQQNN